MGLGIGLWDGEEAENCGPLPVSRIRCSLPWRVHLWKSPIHAQEKGAGPASTFSCSPQVPAVVLEALPLGDKEENGKYK